MKHFNFILALPPRQLLLRGLARLHCGLAAAMVFAAVFALLPMTGLSVGKAPEEVFLRGLLFAIPTALCYYAIKGLKALWQFCWPPWGCADSPGCWWAIGAARL